MCHNEARLESRFYPYPQNEEQARVFYEAFFGRNIEQARRQKIQQTILSLDPVILTDAIVRACLNEVSQEELDKISPEHQRVISSISSQFIKTWEEKKAREERLIRQDLRLLANLRQQLQEMQRISNENAQRLQERQRISNENAQRLQEMLNENVQQLQEMLNEDRRLNFLAHFNELLRRQDDFLQRLVEASRALREGFESLITSDERLETSRGPQQEQIQQCADGYQHNPIITEMKARLEALGMPELSARLGALNIDTTQMNIRLNALDTTEMKARLEALGMTELSARLDALDTTEMETRVDVLEASRGPLQEQIQQCADEQQQNLALLADLEDRENEDIECESPHRSIPSTVDACIEQSKVFHLSSNGVTSPSVDHATVETPLVHDATTVLEQDPEKILDTLQLVTGLNPLLKAPRKASIVGNSIIDILSDTKSVPLTNELMRRQNETLQPLIEESRGLSEEYEASTQLLQDQTQCSTVYLQREAIRMTEMSAQMAEMSARVDALEASGRFLQVQIQQCADEQQQNLASQDMQHQITEEPLIDIGLSPAATSATTPLINHEATTVLKQDQEKIPDTLQFTVTELIPLPDKDQDHEPQDASILGISAINILNDTRSVPETHEIAPSSIKALEPQTTLLPIKEYKSILNPEIGSSLPNAPRVTSLEPRPLQQLRPPSPPSEAVSSRKWAHLLEPKLTEQVPTSPAVAKATIPEGTQTQDGLVIFQIADDNPIVYFIQKFHSFLSRILNLIFYWVPIVVYRRDVVPIQLRSS